MTTLSRSAILGHKDTRIGKVDVPEMGGEVGIASFTAGEADKIKTLGETGFPMTVDVVVMGACDDKGVRLFTMEDRPALTALPAICVGRIANAILDHNGLTVKARDEAKNGSSETETEGSDSASPSPSDEPSKS